MNTVLADRLQKLCDRDNPSYDLFSTAKGIRDGHQQSQAATQRRSVIQIETILSTPALIIFYLVVIFSSSMNRDNMPSA